MNRRKPYGLYIMLVLAALWIVFFLCAPYIAPYNPEATNVAERLQDISSTHWLGTDQLGRDVWSRILYGGKASLWIAFTIIGISGAIGIVIGGPSITNVIISLCITKWAEYARITRGLVHIERHAEYITFARMSGASRIRILWRYILPNVLPPLLIVIIQHLGDAIILVASFSLIGIGVQPPDPEWGAILLSSRDFLQTAPWLLIYPGLAIFITVVLFNYIGDALRDALDVSR